MPWKPIDIIGYRFGRLTVIEYAGRARDRHSMWKVHCDCGNTITVIGNNMKSGQTLSCGCLQRELTERRALKHGEARIGKVSREYRAWCEMKTRCENSKRKSWKYYGERGIKICQEWSKSFAAFRKYMGICPNGLTLDRINNDGNYEPGNCRWATRKEQVRNSSRCPKS